MMRFNSRANQDGTQDLVVRRNHPAARQHPGAFTCRSGYDTRFDKRVLHPLIDLQLSGLQSMKLLKTKDVARITDLSVHQVREWTERRQLIPPIVAAHGPGTRNLFSWREVILLRITAAARKDFGIELEALRPFLSEFRKYLGDVSFPALWDKVVLLHTPSNFRVADASERVDWLRFTIVLPMNPHLTAISNEVSEFKSTDQLTLPLLSVQR